jgi:hypothetical protein
VPIFDDLIATENPPAEKNIQVLALNVTTEGRKAANVCDEKPAGNAFDLSQRTLHHVRSVLLGNRNGLTEGENLISYCDLIAIA